MESGYFMKKRGSLVHSVEAEGLNDMALTTASLARSYHCDSYETHMTDRRTALWDKSLSQELSKYHETPLLPSDNSPAPTS